MNYFISLVSRYGSFSPNHLSNLNKWNFWDLLHIHSGKLTVLISNKKMEIQQGESILIPPDTEFRIQNGSIITTASVQYFELENLAEINQRISHIRNPIVFHPLGMNQIESHILELMSIYSPNRQNSRKQELLLELIIEKMTSNLPIPDGDSAPWGKVIQKYISQMENPPSMNELAHLTGYSDSRFRILFQRDMGLPPMRYFLNIKLENTAKQLTETILPVKKIALNHGYKEVSHFTRAFSKHFGISPARYRKKHAFMG